MYARRGASADDEASLVRQARLGEADAFEVLVDRHTPRLYRVVRRLASDRSEAEAIVQETWLRAWRSLEDVDEDRPVLPWLTRIAVNVARDIWRRQRTLDFAELGEAVEALESHEPGPEPMLDRRQALERLSEGVGQLRPEHRMVIALRYDGGLSYEQIAQSLGIPANTVRTHLHRAKAALRKWMEAENAGLDG